MDSAFVAATAPLQPAFRPLAQGAHTVVCADEAGGSASVHIAVQ